MAQSFTPGKGLLRSCLECQKLGIGYFKFNTRGNNIAVRGPTKREPLIGAGFENFKKCIYDIETVIKLARRLGYRNIILAGHSTGANKILYYQYKKTNRNIKALLLLGPINDICARIKTEGRKKLEQGPKIAQRLKNKDPNSLMPKRFGLLSAQRFLSLFSSNSAENVFPYNNSRTRWKELKSIKIPIMVAVSENDQYLDREANQLIKIFREKAVSTKKFYGVIIKDTDHDFNQKEKELAKNISLFIKELQLTKFD